jgi:hypothetical protein
MTACHKHNLKPSLIQYIYPVSFKNAKRQTLEKRICPIENCRYAIKANMSDSSKVLKPVDILRDLNEIRDFDKPDSVSHYLNR